MKREAYPWVPNVQCGFHRIPVDMRIEDYGLGILPEKYERELEQFFGTTDKYEMQRRVHRMKNVLVLCPGNIIELVEKDSGDLIRKVASYGRMAERIASEMIKLRIASCARRVYDKIPNPKTAKA